MRLADCAHADHGYPAQRAGAIGALLAVAASLGALPAGANTTVCSVFDGAPCTPDLSFPFSQDPLVTIQTRPETRRLPPPGQALNTLQELFAAMELCWRPPPLDQSHPGTEITIRFSLNRSGDIIGEPRFTYATPSLSSDVKAAYQRSLADMLKRCTPFNLSPGLGGAIAGRPLSTRFIDDRGLRRTEIRYE
jgi:hypothetical protein